RRGKQVNPARPAAVTALLSWRFGFPPPVSLLRSPPESTRQPGRHPGSGSAKGGRVTGPTSARRIAGWAGRSTAAPASHNTPAAGQGKTEPDGQDHGN